MVITIHQPCVECSEDPALYRVVLADWVEKMIAMTPETHIPCTFRPKPLAPPDHTGTPTPSPNGSAPKTS